MILQVFVTSDQLLDEFQLHMESKYEITSNDDEMFLGVQMERYVDEVSLPQQVKYIFRKPHQMQNIFDKYLASGPVISAPKDPMRESYSKLFDAEDSSPCEVTEFRSMLGAIMQLTDIVDQIFVSQYQRYPSVNALPELKAVMR